MSRIQKMRGEKEDLKNPLASRLVEFDTTLKLLRLADQWYMVPVVDKFFGCNRMQLGNTRDLYVLRQDVYERFLCIQRPGFSENVVYINKLLNSDRRFILRSDKLKLLQLKLLQLKLLQWKKYRVNFSGEKKELSWLSIFWEYAREIYFKPNLVLVKVSQNHFHGLLRILISSLFDSEDDYRTGCHCQQQQSYSGLRSPGRSNSTYFWNEFPTLRLAQSILKRKFPSVDKLLRI